MMIYMYFQLAHTLPTLKKKYGFEILKCKQVFAIYLLTWIAQFSNMVISEPHPKNMTATLTKSIAFF